MNEDNTYIKLSDAIAAVRDYCKSCIDHGEHSVDTVDLALYMAQLLNTLPQCKIEQQSDCGATVNESGNSPHWEYDPNANDWNLGGWCCSRCHYKNDVLGMSKKLTFPISMIAGTKFCPNCGAKMNTGRKMRHD